MAPLPTIADVYRCALEWTNSADPSASASNVIHVKKSGSNSAAVAAALEAAATPNMWRAQGTNAAVTRINITPLNGSGVTFPYTPTTPANWKGTQTSNTPLLQVANLIKLVTASRGRSFRGRVYLPWTDEQAVNAQKLDTGFASLISTAWIAFNTSLNTAGFPIQVASYTLAVSTPIAALASELEVATQRRRLVRNSNTT